MKKKSQNKNKRVLITAALPYINNLPHLGHIVGSHLPADIFARYCRLQGFDVLFVGGTDEYGTPSELAASKIGIDIKKFCDRIHLEHKKIYNWFNISYDIFSRTSKKIHYKTTQDFFREIYKNNYVSKGKLQLFFCPKDKRYLLDRYIKGTCPKCGYKNASGDQCEKCGSFLETKELLNPRCVLCGSVPILKESEHLFFRLDKLSNQLKKWLNSKKGLWRPQVLNWALGWITKEGLKPRCITRDLKWGIKVPLRYFRNKVFYVWFDAPIGYISATKEIAPKKWKKFWKDPETKIFHFLGKDNIPFHAIFWPAILIANKEFNLPYQVIGLQYLNYERGKFSKTQKRGVFCKNLMEARVDPEVIRAYLIFLIPETADTEFTWRDFQEKINNNIIGNYTNFVNRTLSFIYNKLKREIIKPSESELSNLDKKLINTTKKKIEIINQYLERVELRKAFEEILNLSNEGNKYFDYNAPWKLVKKDKDKTKKILYLCANLCRTLSILSLPYLPIISQKIWTQLNLKEKLSQPETWISAGEIRLPLHHKISKPFILLKKITPDFINETQKTTLSIKDIKEFFN